MKLNEKIYYYRKRAKLSQEELAAQVGVSRQAVSKWELGDATPELDKLAALAKAFRVTTDELLSEGEPEADGEKREERQTQEFSYQKERGRAAWGFLERMAHPLRLAGGGICGAVRPGVGVGGHIGPICLFPDVCHDR